MLEALAFDVSDYEYAKTVFVRGNLHNYVRDLEGYFRRDVPELEKARNVLTMAISAIKDRIEMQKRETGNWDCFWGLKYVTSCWFPFEITKDNAEEAIKWAEGRKAIRTDLMNIQKMNQSCLREILNDPSKITSLDLTNYNHANLIIRIESTDEPSIRMRLFANEDYSPYYPGQDVGEGFAFHAGNIRDVEAELVREEDVKHDIKTIDKYLETGKIRKHRLRVVPLSSEVCRNGEGLKYKVQLEDGEVEMLKHFSDLNEDGEHYYDLNKARELCNVSPSWSPSQGWKLLRNLYGVVSIYDEGRGKPYIFFIPDENSDEVNKALVEGGRFVKSVREESLPALAAVFQRTMELREEHGWDFYPRFSITETANRSGMSKDEAEKSLQDLTGILCKVNMLYPMSKKWGDGKYNFHTEVPKWFLPKTTHSLAYRMLDIEGLLL